jgi:Ca2+-binding RTX toxin-like protein
MEILMHSSSMFEQLESRRMCSVSQVGGTVLIEGTNSADQIAVSETIRLSGFSFERFLKISETTGPNTRTTFIRASTVSRLQVNALSGNDTIGVNTSKGATVFAGAGLDTVAGGAGNDNIFGDLNASPSTTPVISGAPGSDVLSGGGGHDLIDGNAGDDVLHGNAGDDTVVGGSGIDKMFGDLGNDFIRAHDNNGGELVDGGDGFDRAEVDDLFIIINGQFVSIRDIVTNVENVIS